MTADCYDVLVHWKPTVPHPVAWPWGMVHISTHKVFNQPPPLQEYDLLAAEPVLAEALERLGAAGMVEQVRDFGKRMASAEVYEWGFLANGNPPTLQSHDRFGHRIDRVDFHPSWHSLMTTAVSNGLHSLPWEPGVKAGHVTRAALTFLASQIEAGHFCPISMTYAVMPSLRLEPEIAIEWEPRVISRSYDRSFQPAPAKAGVLMGMGMTEKQGGSDVRAGTTTASQGDGAYLITGHKWFTSAPMNDAFLILAQTSKGLTCFLLPRFRPDGSINTIRIQRLKDKLGNRSNASAELEFEQAYAVRVGEEGRGIPTILQMVNCTRLDCVTGSAALMRQSLSQAIHHCRYRHAFGSPLIDQPAMLNVLADLEVETEAAALVMIRLAAIFDQAADDPQEESLRRITTPLAKFWITKRCTEVVHESLECLGGNGYVEESILPRLYRESPLNAIWEGSGNIIALDVLRAAATQPESVDALEEELGIVFGSDRRLDVAIEKTIGSLHDEPFSEGEARSLTGTLATVWQASLLLRFGRPIVAEAFLRTRLGTEGGWLYGTLPHNLDMREIIEPAIPRTGA